MADFVIFGNFITRLRCCSSISVLLYVCITKNCLGFKQDLYLEKMLHVWDEVGMELKKETSYLSVVSI